MCIYTSRKPTLRYIPILYNCYCTLIIIIINLLVFRIVENIVNIADLLSCNFPSGQTGFASVYNAQYVI